jgi:uncharacterized protein YlxP (DUF503 family)
MFVLAEEVELHLPHAHSLKDKRQVVKSLIEAGRRRFGISAAEVGRQDSWQRARLGFAVVASSAAHAESILDEVDRFVWSRNEIEILSAERVWLE